MYSTQKILCDTDDVISLLLCTRGGTSSAEITLVRISEAAKTKFGKNLTRAGGGGGGATP